MAITKQTRQAPPRRYPKRARVKLSEIYPGLLDKLPPEILLVVAQNMIQRHAFDLARVDRRRYELIMPEIYRTSVQARGSQSLIWGIRRENLGTIQKALEAGADVNARVSVNEGYVSSKKMAWTQPHKGTWIQRYPHSPLYEAARTGNVQVVKRLLDAGAKVTKTGAPLQEPRTALHAAAYSGNVEVLKMLLATDGADINVKSFYGDGIFMDGVASGSVEMVDYLYNSLDNPAANAGSSSRVLQAAISGRGRAPMLRYLLDTGQFDVNHADGGGITALMAAAETDAEQLRMILEEPGVVPNFRAADSRGSTVLERVVLFGMGGQECIDILFGQHPHGDFDLFDAFAAACKNPNRVQKHIHHLIVCDRVPKAPCRTSGRSWMHAAVENNQAGVVTALRRADRSMLNAQANDGSTPLMEAVSDQSRRRSFKKLLLFKPDLEMANNQGETALHVSCRANNAQAAADLVERGANVHAKTVQGQTPLHLACNSRDNVYMVRVLIEAGASVIELDANGKSPLELASYHGFEQMASEMREQLES